MMIHLPRGGHEALVEAHKNQMAKLEAALMEKMKLLEKKTGSGKTTSASVVGFRKDLRIRRQIGDATQKDRLRLSSLSHQIITELKRDIRSQK